MTVPGPFRMSTAAILALTALVALASPAHAQSAGKSTVHESNLFEKIDTNRDGQVTFEEYAAYRDHVVWAFYDPHGTGQVSRKDYTRGNHVRAVEFARIDTDHNRVLEKAEFDVETKRLFDRRDRRKNGILTPDEFRTQRKTSGTR
jgi:Ca2+-binding EF-hand superfamily protein